MIDPSYMAEFTFQREWVERRGLLLVLAFFLGGLGGGLYLVSLYLDLYIGLVTAFLIVVVGKGASHLLYLGRPLRFWRGFLRPQSSWISRGLIAMSIFIVFSAMGLVPTLTHNAVIQAIIWVSGIVLIAYTGFALGVVKAIPFWNTALMPVLFIACSLLGGSSLALALSLGGGYAIDVAGLEMIIIWLLIGVALLIGIYLWLSYHGTRGGKKSVLELIKGRVSPYFIGGVVILGIVLPLTIAGIAYLHEIPTAVLLVGVGSELIGGFFIRYSILKAGIYAPLI